MKKWKILHDSDRQSQNSKSKASLKGDNQDKARSKQYLPLRRSKAPSLYNSKNSSVTHSQIFFPLNIDTDKFIKCQTNSLNSNESRSNLTTHRKTRNSQNFHDGHQYLEDGFRLLTPSLQYIQNQHKERIQRETNLILSQRIILKDKQKMQKIKVILKRGQKSMSKQECQNSCEQPKEEGQKIIKRRGENEQKPKQQQQKQEHILKDESKIVKERQGEEKKDISYLKRREKGKNPGSQADTEQHIIKDERKRSSLCQIHNGTIKMDKLLSQISRLKGENKDCIKQIRRQFSIYSHKIGEQKGLICRQVGSYIKSMQEEYHNSKVEQIFDQYYSTYKPKIDQLDLQKQKLLQQLIKLSPL